MLLRFAICRALLAETNQPTYKYLHTAVREGRALPDDLVGTTPECIQCPSRLAICNGIELGYKGHMWHAPNEHPNNLTLAYVCPLDGCPDRGWV
jgi:hypothetical protein